MTFDNFSTDSKTIDAIISNFEIIGEASNLLPEEFKDRHSSIEWHRIRGFRNRIVHDYFGIDLQIIWEIIAEQIPSLIAEIENIFNP